MASTHIATEYPQSGKKQKKEDVDSTDPCLLPLSPPLSRARLRKTYDHVVSFIASQVEEANTKCIAELGNLISTTPELLQALFNLDLVSQIFLQHLSPPHDLCLTSLQQKQIELTQKQARRLLDCLPRHSDDISSAQPSITVYNVQLMNVWYDPLTRLYHWSFLPPDETVHDSKKQPENRNHVANENVDDDDHQNVVLWAVDLDRKALAEEEDILISMANTPIAPTL